MTDNRMTATDIPFARIAMMLAGLCALFLTGCSAVVMNEPFPNTPLPAKEQDKLTGSWMVAGEKTEAFPGIYHVAFNSNGVPQLAVVDFEDDQFKLMQIPITVNQQGENFYLSVREDEADTNSPYIFMEFKATSQGVVLWLPDKEALGGMVEAGILEGGYKDGKKKNNLLLTTPSTNILKLITTEYEVFNYKEPILLQRL